MIIKKNVNTIGLFLLLSFPLCSFATYPIASCYTSQGQFVLRYVCFTNHYWATPLWVGNINPGPGSSPGGACVKDTGGVFNSSLDILDDCAKYAGAGSKLVYSEV